ncbi:MAG: inositol monophosphatase family protein, partial [Opitutales bacterium]
RLFEAVREQGVRMDGEPWELSATAPRSETQLRFYCDCTFEESASRDAMSERMLAFAEAQGYVSGEVIIGGGAVLNACKVLLNRPAIYFKRPKVKTGGGSIWDFAATACLFHDAGASATDFSGKPLELNDPTKTFFNHCGVCYTSEPELCSAVGNFFS